MLRCARPLGEAGTLDYSDLNITYAGRFRINRPICEHTVLPLTDSSHITCRDMRRAMVLMQTGSVTTISSEWYQENTAAMAQVGKLWRMN